MKHSDNEITKRTHPALSAVLQWLVPVMLVVPCVALDFTEISYTWLDRAINVLLPGGVYLLLMSVWRRNGVTTLCLLPVMALCAFQLVLLFLYGESIIAVDMFLNVVTTNVHEAGELLRNLRTAIIVVCILYMPLIIIAVIALAKGSRLKDGIRRAGLIAGGAMTVAGVILLIVGVAGKGYRADRRLFPVNVVSNMLTAGERTVLSEAYVGASADFTFGARSLHDSSEPEVYVLVVGETSRAGNWELNGYERPTNSRLSHRKQLISFGKVLSESNTTHKSVPLMLSHLDSSQFGDSIYCSHGIIDAFAEAGYHTAWLSNQDRNGQLIDFFGNRADDVHFIHDDGHTHHDLDLCPYLRAELSAHPDGKVFVVLHTYGSHFNYTERYPREYELFGHVASASANPANRQELIDAYDNSIAYTDAVVDSIIGTVEATGRPAAVLYLADHGEDIYDDSRERFLHASPTPTYRQLHVPMLMWVSDAYRARHPGKYEAAEAHADMNVSSSRSAFHTMLDLAGITTDRFASEASLCSTRYTEPVRMYLNDYNEAVPLTESGLRDLDFAQLAAHSINF